MAEMEPSENCYSKKRNRQPVSVPFVWEEKPGTPKKDWKPSTKQVNPVVVPVPPVKLVASVPFDWEEKPGTPLPRFFQQPPDVETRFPSEEQLIVLESPPADSQDKDNGSWGDDNGNEGEQDSTFQSAVDTCSFETNESFCSAASLPANGLALTVDVSEPVPLLQIPPAENDSGELKSPTSETGSSSSSYGTGTSLVGEAFLECLFPLLSPKLSFLEKLGCSEKDTSCTPRKVESRDFDRESNCSVAVRRPTSTTLGELIMMSRRRSYRRKAVQMRRQNLPMESMKNKAIGCCVFGIDNRIEELQRNWKRQLRLKLV